MQQDGDTFTGLCCCLDVEDYRKNRIRRHEQTRYDKEEDRTRHIEAVKAHNGPVVLLYRNTDGISSFIESLVATKSVPDAEVRTPEGSVHQIYAITDVQALDRLERAFSKVQSLYIADGHHRAKAAVNVADRRLVPVFRQMARSAGLWVSHLPTTGCGSTGTPGSSLTLAHLPRKLLCTG